MTDHVTTMPPPEVRIDGEELSVTFDRFDRAAYELFLRVKRLPEYRIRTNDTDLTYEVTAPARFAHLLGAAVDRTSQGMLPMPSFLLDDQRAIVRMALEAKRFADWKDCGLGKTLDALEWSRQVNHITGGRVLIVTLNDLVDQFVAEARKFYGGDLTIARLDSREAMREWCAKGSIAGESNTAAIAITNYEKFNHRGEADQVVHELRHLAGIVLDESSRLKTGGGKQKWALIKSSRGIAYKLSCTATPAPNEYMEFASQASWLEKLRNADEILWTYFTRDPKTHRWTIKEHAKKAFFEFMAGWSIYVRDPRKYGWRDGVPMPPEPTYFVHEIGITPAQREFVLDFNAKSPLAAGDESGTAQMFAGTVNAIANTKLSQAAKGFVYVNDDDARAELRSNAKAFEGESVTFGGGESSCDAVDGAIVAGKPVRLIDSLKPGIVADLIVREVFDGHRVLVWTVFDAETVLLQEAISAAVKQRKKVTCDPQVGVLTGATAKRSRAEILDRFKAGGMDVLISRAGMLGYGQNFQACTSMVFYGWTFSYEQFYQALRRAFRFGQTQSLRVHLPIIPELEGQMYDAIVRKQGQHEAAIAEMEANYIAARTRLLVPGDKVECAA